MRSLIPTLTLVAVMSIAQSATEVELTAEPHHHLILQNEYVRVFQVEIPSGDSTLLHRHHHDYVAIHPGESDISNEVVGKPPVAVKRPVGETHFTPGNFSHVVRNMGKVPFRSVDVELQQDRERKTPPAPFDEERGLKVLDGGTQDILFVKDGVRVSEIDLQPGGMTPLQSHTDPHLLVAITEVNLASHTVGNAAAKVELKAGSVQWAPAGMSPALMNQSKQEAKFVLLEFH